MRNTTFCLIITIILFIGSIGTAHGQMNRMFARAVIVDGDTIPFYTLKEIQISASSCLLSAKEIKQNQRLIRNVKKMLPYAQLARKELDKLERECQNLPSKKRKELIKKTEKEMLAQYTDELKNFTTSQGLVLLKLVDRETSKTSYVIVKDLRGKLRAGFYQTFAKVFGYNLKEEFDPKNNKKDDLINRICLMIEAGKL